MVYFIDERASWRVAATVPDSFIDYVATEPSDTNYSVIKVSRLRLNRLARPDVVLPRIMRTNFRDLNATCELSCFFDVLYYATENGGCKIPLGQFNDVTYSFSPTGSILQLQEKVRDQQSAEPAPAAYFCVQKQDLDHVSQLPWGGSSASSLQIYATSVARTLSLRSVNSEDSGYASENAHHVSKDLLTISKDKIEEQVGYGGKRSVKNRDRTLSLRSNRFEDSGYASGDAHPVSKNLAAISEDKLAEQAKFSLLNGRKSESINDLVMSFPFFTLGRIYSKPTSSEGRPTITDFIVAVSLCDGSLWAIFDAWDEDWIEAEEGDEVDWVGVERHETPLKPLRSITWGRLPGLDGRVQMVKLANSVYTHVFAPTEQIDWTTARKQWGANEIPVLFPAVKALNGPVTSLTHTSHSKEIAKQTSKRLTNSFIRVSSSNYS